MIAVTKGFPAVDVELLASLGVTDVGESRASEGLDKRAAVDSVGIPPLHWHCIGQVQTNKARTVMQWADVIQSVDRPRLVEALGRLAVERSRVLDVLIQVDLSAVRNPSEPPKSTERDRGGCLPSDIEPLAQLIPATAGLRCTGVMAVAPPSESPTGAFARLHQLSEELRRIIPAATIISAGMSGDLHEAIAHGATHVRIGGAILGNRLPEV